MNLSGGRIGQIEVKALRKLRHPSRTIKTKDFLDDDIIELDDNKSNKKTNQSIAEVNLEITNEQETKLAEAELKDVKQNTETIKQEDIAGDTIEKEKHPNITLEERVDKDKSLENKSIEDIELEDKIEEELKEKEENKEEEPLDELSKLLKELGELDQMLKATSIEIKNEKNKKQHNKKIREKMQKVNNMMQDTKGER